MSGDQRTRPGGFKIGQSRATAPGTSSKLLTVEVISRSPDQTQAVGRVLGKHAGPGDVYPLVGELGAGKTCLTQGILWGLGGDEYARSPTFVLMSQYQARLTLYHIDLYRLDTVAEVADLGLDEYLFGNGVCVVEWAEKTPGICPPEHMAIRIDRIDESTRRLTLTATGKRFAKTIHAVRAASVSN